MRLQFRGVPLYQKRLHDDHNDYPPAPKTLMITKDEKLIPNLNDKKRYVVDHKHSCCMKASVRESKRFIHRGISARKSLSWRYIYIYIYIFIIYIYIYINIYIFIIYKYIYINIYIYTHTKLHAMNELEKDSFILVNNTVWKNYGTHQESCRCEVSQW